MYLNYRNKTPYQILLGAVLCVAAVLPAQAQLVADVCKGSTRIVSQEQTETGLDMAVEVTVEGCDGVCIGSIEYVLLFTDADNNEIKWHMTETWDWQDVHGPFTLNIHDNTLPGAQLKEVQAMQIGRCSCSTRASR
jgi:hypothetical protein